MKRTIFLLLFLIVFTQPLQIRAFELSAESAVLIDAETGRVIYSKNSRERMGMASTTKIMTALVALDKYNPDDVVTASYKASNTEGSSIYLKPGEKMSLEHVLYGLMLASGNDASVAISEHIAGNEYTFVEYMNRKAANLNLLDTHFENPNGLSHENHYTTAYDLSQITREALKNEKFRQVVSTKNKVLKSLSGENDRYIKNHNKLLWQYDGCIGVKTGFTKKDGRCLVSAAEKDGITLIAVTLNAPDDWNDHKKLFDYGFSNLTHKRVIRKGEKAKTVNVNNGVLGSVDCIFSKEISVSVKKEENVLVKLFVPEVVDAPVKEGQQIGFAKVYVDQVQVDETSVIASQNIDVTKETKLVQQFINLFTILI